MKFDLKRLFLLNNLLTALLPVICIGALSLLIVKSHLSKEMDHNGVLFARSLASQIATYLQEPAGSFNLISRHLFAQKHSSAERTNLLDLLAASYEYFDALYLLDNRGIVQQAGFKELGQQSRGDFHGMDFSNVDACRKALVDHKLHWDPSVSMSSGDPTMSFCGAINGGALLAELKLTDLGRIINEASAGRIFTSFIVDRAGRIIVHPDAEIARQKENIGNLPLVRMGLSGKESTDNFTFHRVEYRGTAILLPGLEWVLVVAQEMDTVMAPVQTLQRVLIIVILGTLLLAVSLGVMGSRLLRRPFEHLAENARLVIREEYESIRPVTSPCQEIVLLSETLTGMVHAVRTREEMLNEQTEELMATEEQLREQIGVNEQTLDELQKSLSSLDDAHRQLKDIIEFLPDATLIVDQERRVIAWNQAMEVMTGVPKEDMLGKADCAYAVPFYGQSRPILIDLIFGHGPDAGKAYDSFDETGNKLTGSAFVPACYGGKGAYLSATASPLVDRNGQVVGAIESIRDVTEMRRIQDELQKLNISLEAKVAERTAQLEAANEELMAVNDDLNQREQALEGANRQLEAFAFSVSHDLRAPLRHVSSFATILLDDYGQEMAEDARELSKRIVASCRRMDELINGILEFSRVSRQAVNKTTVNLDGMVREILHEMQGDLSGRAVDLQIGEMPDCQGDPLLLHQVLTNLLSNAIKYTRHQAAARIDVGVVQESGETVYFVRDNGAGFDSAHADKLFGVFQRMHAATEFEGTGIGLAIVANIIQRHGGRIWAEAKVDAGATFFFTLPEQTERHITSS